MQAVVFRGPRSVDVATVDDPRSEAPTDAIVRVTSSALCGSDLHTWGQFFQKGISVRFGRTHDERYNLHRRDLILAKRVKPSVIVSHHLPPADAPDAYAKFDARGDGYVKVVFKP